MSDKEFIENLKIDLESEIKAREKLIQEHIDSGIDDHPDYGSRFREMRKMMEENLEKLKGFRNIHE